MTPQTHATLSSDEDLVMNTSLILWGLSLAIVSVRKQIGQQMFEVYIFQKLGVAKQTNVARV